MLTIQKFHLFEHLFQEKNHLNLGNCHV